MAYLRAYCNHVEKLVKCLPMDDTHFITKLSAQQLLPGDTESKIKAMSTQADKASYFLSHVIKPALDIDDISDFDKLRTVMRTCGYNHVEKLAQAIEAEINKPSEMKSCMLGKTLICTNWYDLLLYLHYHMYLVSYHFMYKQRMNKIV